MNLLWRNITFFANRKIIQPEAFEIGPFDDLFRVSSTNYQFVIGKKPQANFIYEHDCSTPAAVLKKLGIHLFPSEMPEVNKREKYSAVVRLLESNYENAYKNCKSAKEIFNLQRKIKSEIRHRLYFVGCLDGKKHRHILKYKPFMEILAQNTLREYEKNGVSVEVLGEKIYPHGKVWMPTSEKYLQHYQQAITAITSKGDLSVLDLGCGSGILSFLFAKQFRKSRIVAIDNNPDAVRTCNINAARLEYRNIEAIEFDLSKQQFFQNKITEFKLPKTYNWIVINPPWLVSSRIEGESSLSDGVYDHSNMLKKSLNLSKRVLSSDGRIIVIYSDLSELLGLCTQSFEELCIENGFLVEEKQEQMLHEEMVKKSAISQFKTRSKIITYTLKRS